MSEPWSSPERDEWERPGLSQPFDSASDSAPEPPADAGSSSELPPVEVTEGDLLPVRRPGPGLGEALLWTVGALLAQGVGILALVLLEGGVPNFAQIAADDPQRFVLMLGVLQSGVILCAVVAAALRFRGKLPQNIPLTPIRVRHAIMMAVLVFPLALSCNILAETLRDAWNAAAERFPQLEKHEGIELNEALSKVAGRASFPLLLLVIAVAPALGEELVFRGVIGRGLTARWGLVGGVLITSVLFALAHADPVHIVGVIPLGIMMHVIYLATRSFWAPVLFHFANNAMAVTGLKMAAIAGAAEQPPMEAPDLPLFVFLTAGLCVVSVALLLWKTRVRYHLPDGSIWNPGYPTVERPPQHLAAEARCRAASPWLVALAVACVVAFGLSFVVATVQAVLNT